MGLINELFFFFDFKIESRSKPYRLLATALTTVLATVLSVIPSKFFGISFLS